MPVYFTAVDLAEISPFRIAHVLGTSGVLTSIGVSSQSGFHHFRIEVDSNTVIDADLLDPFSGLSLGGGSFPVNLPFENSLNVFVHSVDTYPQAKFWASFVTNGAELLHKEEATYAQNEIEYDFARLVLRSGPGAHTYSVEIALRPSRWCKINLERDTLISGASVRGRLTFPAKAAASQARPRLVIRLAGMRWPLGSLDLAYHDDNDDNVEFEWPWSDFQVILRDIATSEPMQHGGRIDFEIIADIPGFLSYPARFSVV